MEAKFKYAVRKAGSNYGIEDIKQLKDLVAKGKVDPSDYVFLYKTEEWKCLGELAELRAFFPGFNAGATTRTPSSDKINSLPNLRQIEAAQKNNASNAAQSAYRPKNEASQSKLDVSSLFADVPDKLDVTPRSATSTSSSSLRLTPFVPGAAANQASRPAMPTIPRPGLAQNAQSGANPFGSSSRLPRLESGETPMPPASGAKDEGRAALPGSAPERPNYLRYVLFLVLVAMASGALTFFIMRHGNEDSVVLGTPLPVRSSR